MSLDITSVLKDWQFSAEDICVRKIQGLDGREKLQVRVDLGVLQMEITGRPDGTCPHNRDSVLDHYLARLADYRARHGADQGFQLGEEACAELGQEGLQYTCLLSLEDYSGVVRDTAHNMAILDLVEAFAENEDYRLSFGQYRPYVIMIHTRARGELRLQQDDHDGALQVAEKGMAAIRSFFQTFSDPELTQMNEELQALESWSEEIRNSRPVDLKQRLVDQLQEAIAEEKYEQAAELRDRLRKLSPIGS